MKDSGIILDFTGLPGCGKSTLCKSLLQACSSHEIVTYQNYYQKRFGTPTKKIRLIGACFSPFLLSLIKYILFNPLRQKRIPIRNLLNLYVTYKDFLSNSKRREILLVDQGILQGIVFANYNQKELRQKYLDGLINQFTPLLNNITFVNCLIEEDECYRRLMLRRSQQPNSKGRFDKLPSEKIMESIQQANGIYKELYCIIQKSKLPFDIIDVVMNENTSKSAETLVEYLEKNHQ